MQVATNKKKLLKLVCEFENYIRANGGFIPNYGDRYRHNETITTAFVESTVNYVITEQPPAKAGGLAITTKVGIRVKDPFSSPF